MIVMMMKILVIMTMAIMITRTTRTTTTTTTLMMKIKIIRNTLNPFDFNFLTFCREHTAYIYLEHLQGTDEDPVYLAPQPLVPHAVLVHILAR